jgi:tetratricopeptide (TPR) repeat protein
MPHHCVLAGLDDDASFTLLELCFKRAGAGVPDRGLMREALTRVAGHPYFIRLVAELSRKYPLAQLLTSLPPFVNRAQAYVREQVIDLLPGPVKALLARLSLLRIPFRMDVVETLGQGTGGDGWDSLQIAVDKFLVMRHAADVSKYDIHAIVKEVASVELDSVERAAAHSLAYEYYRDRGNKSVEESCEGVYHALRADRASDAAAAATQILRALLIAGLPDVLLEWTGSLLDDEHASKWPLLHFQRGRVLRMKGRLQEALAAYESARSLAVDPHIVESAKAEIASLLVLQGSDANSPEWKRARSIYEELLASSDSATRVSVLLSLGWLKMKCADSSGIQNIHDALKFAEEFGLQRQIAQSCYFLGRIYASDDWERAAEYLVRSISTWDDLQEHYGAMNWDGMYHSADLLADLFMDVEHYEGAIVPANLCVDLDRKLGREDRLAGALFRLGRAYCMNKRSAEAVAVLEESLTLTQNLGLGDEAESGALEFLIVSWWDLELYVKALECMAEYRRVCARGGFRPKPYLFIPESEAGVIAAEMGATAMRLRVLKLPADADMYTLRGWIEVVIGKFPEFRDDWMTNSTDDDIDGSGEGLF